MMYECKPIYHPLEPISKTDRWRTIWMPVLLRIFAPSLFWAYTYFPDKVSKSEKKILSIMVGEKF